MSHKTPPAPPANQSPKGPGDDKRAPAEQGRRESRAGAEKRGQEANIKQNTTNQGLQQDR
ncbi:MAG TPA: hypothetical protein VKU03_03880 [Roseiarcus sp.]|nr:hypothetical protein [Roseiarcus sp.]